MTVENETELLDFVFGIENKCATWLASWSIICPTNSEVDAIKNTIMNTFPGDVKVYRSNDCVEENKHLYPIVSQHAVSLTNAASHITAKKAQHHHAVA